MLDPFLKSMIYGGMDGIITIFNIISSTSGLKLQSIHTLIITVTVLIADGLSMGISDYTSYEAENKQNRELYTKKSPLHHGLITFGSFVFFGAIPLILYFIITNYYPKNHYVILLVIMSFAFFGLGSLQSFYTDEKWYKVGIKTVLYGDTTSLIAFLISNKLSIFFK